MPVISKSPTEWPAEASLHLDPHGSPRLPHISLRHPPQLPTASHGSHMAPHGTPMALHGSPQLHPFLLSAPAGAPFWVAGNPLSACCHETDFGCPAMPHLCVHRGRRTRARRDLSVQTVHAAEGGAEAAAASRRCSRSAGKPGGHSQQKEPGQSRGPREPCSLRAPRREGGWAGA